MTKGFWTRLIIPLAIASALGVAIHLYWKADGFFLNLATELAGILITLCYVDWVLREHERDKWQLTDARIADRLRVLLNAIVSSIRDGFGYGTEIFDERIMNSRDLIAMHKECMRVGEHLIAPNARQRVHSLDVAGWKSLENQIRHVHNAVLSFFSAFQSRLSPDQISNLLDIQDGLSKSTIYYTMFPDILGVPQDQLPQSRTPPEELQQIGCQSTADDLSRVLVLAAQLSRTIANN